MPSSGFCSITPWSLGALGSKTASPSHFADGGVLGGAVGLQFVPAAGHRWADRESQGGSAVEEGQGVRLRPSARRRSFGGSWCSARRPHRGHRHGGHTCRDRSPTTRGGHGSARGPRCRRTPHPRARRSERRRSGANRWGSRQNSPSRTFEVSPDVRGPPIGPARTLSSGCDTEAWRAGPQPPPPGVSIRRTSPARRRTVHLSGSLSRWTRPHPARASSPPPRPGPHRPGPTADSPGAR